MKASKKKKKKNKTKQGCSAKMKSTFEVLKTELSKLKSRLNRLEWVEYELKIHVYSEPSEWPYLEMGFLEKYLIKMKLYRIRAEPKFNDW